MLNLCINHTAAGNSCSLVKSFGLSKNLDDMQSWPLVCWKGYFGKVPQRSNTITVDVRNTWQQQVAFNGRFSLVFMGLTLLLGTVAVANPPNLCALWWPKRPYSWSRMYQQERPIWVDQISNTAEGGRGGCSSGKSVGWVCNKHHRWYTDSLRAWHTMPISRPWFRGQKGKFSPNIRCHHKTPKRTQIWASHFETKPDAQPQTIARFAMLAHLLYPHC